LQGKLSAASCETVRRSVVSAMVRMDSDCSVMDVLGRTPLVTARLAGWGLIESLGSNDLSQS
jgi:hypothetical protein